jgi:hypothetical protein
VSSDRRDGPAAATHADAAGSGDPDRFKVHERQLAYVRESVLLGIRYAGERRAATQHPAG